MEVACELFCFLHEDDDADDCDYQDNGVDQAVDYYECVKKSCFRNGSPSSWCFLGSTYSDGAGYRAVLRKPLTLVIKVLLGSPY